MYMNRCGNLDLQQHTRISGVAMGNTPNYELVSTLGDTSSARKVLPTDAASPEGGCCGCLLLKKLTDIIIHVIASSMRLVYAVCI